MAWTKEQLMAITMTGKNIIVSAGAGSGKTAVLSTRVIEKLKNGIHINELLILTFTNAAAAEMKERIKKNIKKENLLEELDLLDSSYITTFDSYALAIVKKYHYILNIPKEINITDSTIINTSKRKILNEVMEPFYEQEEEKFYEWITTFCEKDDSKMIEELLTLANKLEIKDSLEEFLTSYINNNYNEKKYMELVNNYIKLLNEKKEELQNEIENNQCYFETEYLNKIKDSLNSIFYEDDLNSLIAKILVAKIPQAPRGSEEETKKAKEEINKKLKELKEFCSYGYQNDLLNEFKKSKDYILVIIEILQKYFLKLKEYKAQNNIYDFTDIAKMSLKLIKENENIQKEIRDSFKEIMVDEYQDTSDIQEEFLKHISNNNVYMVGDIKQSIYRFRNANPNIFKNKYDSYSKNENGIKIDLLKNFRSRSEVLDNINIIFNKIMDNKIGNAEYLETHQMIHGNSTYNNEGKTDQNYNMEVLEYSVDSNKYSKEEIEIFTIAKDIKEKINNHYLVFNKDTLKLNPATYSDFVIIMDRNTTFDLAKKIFEYMGIPLSLYKDEDLNSSNDIFIIKNIINLLIHIKKRNFNKEYLYSFTSIARSFLYRLEDQEIFNYIKENNTLNSKIYHDLKPIADNLLSLSIEEILLKILNHTKFYEKLITNGNIEETIKRIGVIIELGSNIHQINYDIFDFYNFLEEILKNKEQIKFNLGSTTSNSVKIMNIHKSKGLEFPICYFCGLYKIFSKEDIKGDIIYENGLPIYTPIFKEGIKETFIKLLIKDKILKDDISEKIRLFYVALTRAKEKMIFILPKKDALIERKMANGVILDNIRYKYKSLADILYSIPNELKFYKKEIDINSLNLTKDYLLPKEKKRDCSHSLEPLNIELLNMIEEEISTNTFSKKTNELIDMKTKRNIDFGNIFHETLELIDFRNFDEDLIENNFIKERIKDLLENSLLKDIENAEIFQEYEFIYQEDNTEYHGKIDLMLKYNTHIDIIDYKLNNIIDKSYHAQLKGYQKYIKTNTNLPVNIYVYSILTKEIIKL